MKRSVGAREAAGCNFHKQSLPIYYFVQNLEFCMKTDLGVGMSDAKPCSRWFENGRRTSFLFTCSTYLEMNSSIRLV